jgi:hypothetical protein
LNGFRACGVDPAEVALDLAVAFASPACLASSSAGCFFGLINKHNLKEQNDIAQECKEIARKEGEIRCLDKYNPHFGEFCVGYLHDGPNPAGAHKGQTNILP